MDEIRIEKYTKKVQIKEEPKEPTPEEKENKIFLNAMLKSMKQDKYI